MTGTDYDPTATFDSAAFDAAAPVSPAVVVEAAATGAEPAVDPDLPAPAQTHADQPAIDQPASDQPASDEAASDQPTSDQPTGGGPVPVPGPPRTRRSSPRARARRRRLGRSVRRWAVGPGGRFVLPTLAVLVLLAGGVVGGRYLAPAVAPARVVAQPSIAPTRSTVHTAPSQAPDDLGPSIDPQPTGSADANAPTPNTRPQYTLAAWAARMSQAVGVPQVALQAYGLAQLRAQQTLPACHLTWTTLAGIGKIESDHGREGGAFVLADGRALPPIVGAPLDGTDGRALVKDTDHGLLDGDPVYDRAVGPMQFIPDTWTKYQVDADGDGVSDPNDINDASLAAADYLCAGGRNLSDGPSWWSAVLSYNAVRAYAVDVFNAANDYGVKSRTVA